jgi:hypothetical protein
MKHLLIPLLLFVFLQYVQAQDEIVKWTFPTGELSDTIQNGTNPLNLNNVLSINEAGPITMTLGQPGIDYAATATGWDDGMNKKYWLIKFKTTGYTNVTISSKQRAGGSAGGPRDFKLQYRKLLSGTWTDVPNGEIMLGNDWFTGAVSNLLLPPDCQNQPNDVTLRWVMFSNTDVNGGTVAANGISKIDDIIVTGILTTSLGADQQATNLQTFPNPSTSSFSIKSGEETAGIEIYNSNGQLVYSTIPVNELTLVEKDLPSGLYFIKAISKDEVSIIKHIVK